MTLIRVFPRLTNATPRDSLAFVGDPPFPEMLPPADEVHISVAFTWDIVEAKRLQRAWERFYPDRVRIGGPAMGSPAREFVPGRYLREGYTITSRGCPNHCPHCLVPGREGNLCALYPVPPGHIEQSNNLLALPELDWWRVLAMLAGQRKAAKLVGGLQADLFTDEKAFELRSNVRVKELFFAYDRPEQWRDVRQAIRTAIYWFGKGREDEPQRKVRCYVFAGYDGDTPKQAVNRCRQVLAEHAVPFLMLWQPADRFIEYHNTEWQPLMRKWMLPAATLTNWEEEVAALCSI